MTFSAPTSVDGAGRAGRSNGSRLVVSDDSLATTLVWSKCGQDRDATAGEARPRHCDLRFCGVARSGSEPALPPPTVRGEDAGARVARVDLLERRAIIVEKSAAVIRWCGRGSTTGHQPGAAGRATCCRQ